MKRGQKYFQEIIQIVEPDVYIYEKFAQVSGPKFYLNNISTFPDFLWLHMSDLIFYAVFSRRGAQFWKYVFKNAQSNSWSHVTGNWESIANWEDVLSEKGTV